MVYLVVDSKEEFEPMLVKAENREEVEKRLSLTESQEIVRSYTSTEINTLETSFFAVVS